MDSESNWIYCVDFKTWMQALRLQVVRIFLSGWLKYDPSFLQWGVNEKALLQLVEAQWIIKFKAERKWTADELSAACVTVSAGIHV